MDPRPEQESPPAAAGPAPSAWRAALGTVGTNAVVAATGLATGSVTARLLGPTGRGELAAIQTIPILLAGLALVGMPSALGYFCARTPGRSRGLVGTAVALGVACALVLSALGWATLPALLARQRPEVVHAARLYLAFVPLQALQGLPHAALLGVGRVRAWNQLRLVLPVGWLALLGLLAASGQRDPATYAFAYLAAYLATVPLVLAAALRGTPPGPLAPTRADARALLAFGAPGALATLPLLLNLRLDQVAMSGLVPPRELGFYVAAVAWSGLLSPVLQATAPILVPLVAAGDDEAARRQRARRAARSAVLVALLGTVALAAATPLAVPLLFGPAFEEAARLALVLVVAGGFAGVNAVLEEVSKGLGAPRWPLLGQLAALPVTLVLLLLLLPRQGSMGAAIASLAAYALTTAVLAAGLGRTTGWPAASFLVPTRAEAEAALSALRRLVPGAARAAAPRSPP